MFCASCGNKISITDKFCTACGIANSRYPAPPSLSVLKSATVERPGIKRAPQPPISNVGVRALFIVGHDQPDSCIEWIKNRYPSSFVERFSTVGAVRQSTANLARQGEIEYLCLVGSSKSVPTCRISEGAHEIDLESDLFYASQRLVVDSVVDFQSEGTFHKGIKYKETIARIGVDEVVGHVPVGRIPFDDFDVWTEYLLSLESIDRNSSGEWIALSNFDAHWVNECRALFNKVGGDDFGSVYAIPDELNQIDGKYKGKGFKPSSRVIINLHGGIPEDIGSDQKFSTEYVPPQKHTMVDPAEYGPYPGSIVFLFACFGGSSKWWETGFIAKFFQSRGLSILASSNTVWVTDLDDTDCSKPSSVKLSAEFFMAIEKHGMSLGNAFSYAKQTVLADALQETDPRYFFKVLKEILQFSLYGAPWVVPADYQAGASHDTSATSLTGTLSVGGSVLDRIRSGSGLQAARQKNTLLSDVRQRLQKSLGPDGVAYFGLNNGHFLETLKESGRYATIAQGAGVAETSMMNARFGVLGINGRSYLSAEIDDSTSGFNQKIMIFLDEENQVVKTFKSKG